MVREYGRNTMNATTEATPKLREPREHVADQLREPPHAVLDDPTTPVKRDAALHGDDQSHTPPHGDAVFPRGLLAG
jgi:hypothetical protein